jgi:hypothetical protein
MSIERVAQKSNKIKIWTQRFLLTSIIQGAIAVSLTIMLTTFVIPPLISTYSSMTDYNLTRTRVIEMEAGLITAFYQNPK